MQQTQSSQPLTQGLRKSRRYRAGCNHDSAASERSGGALLTEQNRFSLGGINDQNDHGFNLRCQLGGRSVRGGAFSSQGLHRLGAYIAGVYLKTCTQQRARDAYAHGAEADDTDGAAHD